VVLAKPVHGLRLFWPDPEIALASKSAICQARYRLGALPVAHPTLLSSADGGVSTPPAGTPWVLIARGDLA
jgi:hypothetical protein